MKKFQRWKGAGTVARHLTICPAGSKRWQLRWKPVCGSTETDMSRWIKEQPFGNNCFRAILAGRQLYGHGQQGKVWSSPKGGVWLSAAFPLRETNQSSGIFGLAVAISLLERLDRQGVFAQIKWPNDLMIGNKKLAGFLTRLTHRGTTLQMARIGLGLNVKNKVPIEGIALGQILVSSKSKTDFWASEVLIAIENAMENFSKPEEICKKVNERLWRKDIYDSKTGETWKIIGIAINGELKLTNGLIQKQLIRW